MRLFCFPHAGGLSTFYTGWQTEMGKGIAITGMDLAGRGLNERKKPYPDFEAAVLDLAGMIEEQLGKRENSAPYALFGHSMGGWLACEAALHLREDGYPEPFRLFLSGIGAPFQKKKKKSKLLLSDEQLVQRIRSLGGTPEEVWLDRELKALFLPMLRGDFRLLDTYEWKPGREKLHCGVCVLCGDEEPDLPLEALLEWQQLTTEKIEIRQFPGGHFYMLEERESVLSFLKGELSI